VQAVCMPLTLRMELMHDGYCCYPVSQNTVTVALEGLCMGHRGAMG